jgi:hypothetical protein
MITLQRITWGKRAQIAVTAQGRRTDGPVELVVRRPGQALDTAPLCTVPCTVFSAASGRQSCVSVHAELDTSTLEANTYYAFGVYQYTSGCVKALLLGAFFVEEPAYEATA